MSDEYVNPVTGSVYGDSSRGKPQSRLMNPGETKNNGVNNEGDCLEL